MRAVLCSIAEGQRTPADAAAGTDRSQSAAGSRDGDDVAPLTLMLLAVNESRNVAGESFGTRCLQSAANSRKPPPPPLPTSTAMTTRAPPRSSVCVHRGACLVNSQRQSAAALPSSVWSLSALLCVRNTAAVVKASAPGGALYYFPTYVVRAAVRCGSTTAGNRKYTAKTANQPYWPQSKRKLSATFRNTTAAFRRQKYW